ncbi:hypothetical protein OQA88_3364 [Cercophora sp. LCS_1]
MSWGRQCVYETATASETPGAALKREKAELEQLIGYLRQPELAHDLVGKLQAGLGIPELLRYASGGGVLNRQPVALLPTTDSPFEVELMVRHPKAYQILDLSIDITYAEGLMSTAGDPGSLRVNVPGSGSSGFISTVLNPPHPVCYYDDRLARLKIGYWSTVKITDAMAAAAFSHFFKAEHWSLGLFDADLFIGDLVSGDMTYCSSFLVNAVLTHALQAYSAKDPPAAIKAVEFEHEAKKLWRVEQGRDSLTTIAGGFILYIAIGIRGQVADGAEYIPKVVAMARRLRLFDTPNAVRLEELASKGMAPEQQRAAIHTAWGVYGAIMMQAIFRVCEAVKYPPLLPIPGLPSLPTKEKEPDRPLTHLEKNQHAFAAICALWRVTADVLAVYHHPDGPTAVSPAFALSLYHRLLNVADEAHVCVTNSEENAAQISMFHVFYHHVVLDIFRPFVSGNGSTEAGNAWSVANVSPSAIFEASLKQLKRLVLRYRSRHLSENFTILWHLSLMGVVNGLLLNHKRDPNWKFYFMMCIAGYEDLYPTFQVALGIAESLMMLAIQKGAITNREAKRMKEQFKKKDRPELVGKTGAGFVVDLELAMTNPKDAGVDVLIDRFEEATAVASFMEDLASGGGAQDEVMA